jgi:hypothetical protein
MNLKSPPLTPDPIPHAPISMVPSIMSYVKFNGKTPHSQRVRRRQTKEPPKKTQEPSAIRPGEGSNLVNTILGIFSTIQKLDVLCYTCLNHIFIRFQYSSQLLKKEQTLRLHTDPATKSLFRAFSCVQHIVRHVGHLYYKGYLLHNKVINVVSTFASISYHWSLSAVIRRTHSNFPMPSSG